MRSLCFLFAMLTTVQVASAEAPVPAPVTESKNQIIKLTDRGLEPRALTMKPEDMVLFFLNDSADSLVTLEVDYGKRIMHCAGGNLRAGDDGVVRSVKPFGPHDFATVCFHDPGTYKVRVFGLKTNPKGIESTITVQ